MEKTGGATAERRKNRRNSVGAPPSAALTSPAAHSPRLAFAVYTDRDARCRFHFGGHHLVKKAVPDTLSSQLYPWCSEGRRGAPPSPRIHLPAVKAAAGQHRALRCYRLHSAKPLRSVVSPAESPVLVKEGKRRRHHWCDAAVLPAPAVSSPAACVAPADPLDRLAWAGQTPLEAR